MTISGRVSLKYADMPANLRANKVYLHAAGPYDGQPSGLRAGSPPSPHPCLIRPTVRRLPWSPRLLGPGPRQIILTLLSLRQ